MANRVGLGTFPLLGIFNAISKSDACKIVQEFLGNGGKYIDTAPTYGFGDIENLLGNCLRNKPRDSFYLITKGGKVLTDDNRIFVSSKYEDIIQECEHSLGRLHLDYVDQYMIHRPDPNTPFEETMRALVKLQSDGKIRDIAVSNVNLLELKEYRKYADVKYVQNRFSLINRSLNQEFKDYLLQNNVKLLPYHLLEIGLLTGSALDGYVLRKGDLRDQLPYWDVKNQQVIAEWIREYVAPIAKGLEITIGQLNMAWALHQNYIDFIVVGTTKQKYIPINLKADSIQLPQKILQDLDDAYVTFEGMITKKYKKSVREFRGLNEKFY